MIKYIQVLFSTPNSILKMRTSKCITVEWIMIIPMNFGGSEWNFGTMESRGGSKFTFQRVVFCLHAIFKMKMYTQDQYSHVLSIQMPGIILI